MVGLAHLSVGRSGEESGRGRSLAPRPLARAKLGNSQSLRDKLGHENDAKLQHRVPPSLLSLLLACLPGRPRPPAAAKRTNATRTVVGPNDAIAAIKSDGAAATARDNKLIETPVLVLGSSRFMFNRFAGEGTNGWSAKPSEAGTSTVTAIALQLENAIRARRHAACRMRPPKSS